MIFSDNMPARVRALLGDAPIHDALDVLRLDDGVWQILPKNAKQSVILSAGIHGNETAPIEILADVFADIMAGRLDLKVNLLLILGNPSAINDGVRYHDFDLNRLFCDGDKKIGAAGQTLARAHTLTHHAKAFLSQHQGALHLDLHTAIRPSLLPTFAILPFDDGTPSAAKTWRAHALAACQLDAVVRHRARGFTFSSLTDSLGAVAATLELGHAKPFGQNQMKDFAPTIAMLNELLADNITPSTHAPLYFDVADSVMKTDDLAFLVDVKAPNFDPIAPNAPIFTQNGARVSYPFATRLLFVNPNVAVGTRAGLVLKQVG